MRPATAIRPAQPQVGPIGTLPGYFEAGLVSDGDPAVAFGPVYPQRQLLVGERIPAVLRQPDLQLPRPAGFKGFEAIAVSRIDGPASTGLTAAIVANQANWKAPVIVSKQNSALFSDKEQVWADNAESSPFFGHTYICSAAFRGVPGTSQPLVVATSTDGGDSWTTRQITPATNNVNSANGFGRSGCTIRTDSHGVAYVFAYQFANGTPGNGFQLMSTSIDGGRHWTKARPIIPATDLCNAFEPSIGRCVEDGIGGARDDLGPSPSVDIANGAPTGADATNLIVDAWADGRDGLNHEHVMFATSTNGGASWTAPRTIETAGDRGYYAAPAISPNGTDVWVVYNAFTTPFRNDTTSPGTSSAWSSTPTSRPVPSGPSARSTAALAAIPGAAARTTWPPSSSATTSTRPPPAPTGLRSGTTSAGPPTARPSTPTVRRSTTRRWRLGGPVAEPEEPRGEEDAVHHEIDAGAGCGRPARPAGLRWHLRELRHLRRHLRRPDPIILKPKQRGRGTPRGAPSAAGGPAMR